jgi:hypothetical protein
LRTEVLVVATKTRKKWEKMADDPKWKEQVIKEGRQYNRTTGHVVELMISAADCKHMIDWPHHFRIGPKHMVDFEATIASPRVDVDYRFNLRLDLTDKMIDEIRSHDPNVKWPALEMVGSLVKSAMLSLAIQQQRPLQCVICAKPAQCFARCYTIVPNSSGYYGSVLFLKDDFTIPHCNGAECVALVQQQCIGVMDPDKAPGELIVKCEKCDKREGKSGDAKKCSRCKAVFYCNRECQKAHWKKHKKHCHDFDPASADNFARMFKGDKGAPKWGEALWKI